MKSWRIRSIGVVVVALVFTLLACGGDDGESDPPDPSDAVPEDTAAPSDDDDSGGDDDAGELVHGRDVPPQPSRGCGSSEADAGQEELTLHPDGPDGDERWYLRHVPQGHDGETPLPLVLDLHGYAEGAEIHATATALADLGDDEGFVTVTPHGKGEGEDGIPFWVAEPGSDDVEFLASLLDDLEDELCVDTARIYAAGLSNGAWMTSVLACEMADRIAAVAPVAGVVHVDDCAAESPVPVVAFHGTDDGLLPYEGGTGPDVDDLPELEDASDFEVPFGMAVPEVMDRWAERNGCAGEDASEDEVADDVTLVQWDCEPWADVQLYRIEGGGHSWPGAEFFDAIEEIVGTTTMSISANEVMWEFFQDHALPARLPPEDG